MDNRLNDEGAITKLVADQAAAWNAGDAHAYASAFAEDGAFVNIRGTGLRGKAAFEQRHAEIFAGLYHGSHQELHIDRLVFLTPESAYVEINAEVTHYRTPPPGIMTSSDGVLRTRLLEVLKKTDGSWRIEAYYNVAVMPNAAPPPGVK